MHHITPQDLLDMGFSRTLNSTRVCIFEYETTRRNALGVLQQYKINVTRVKSETGKAHLDKWFIDGNVLSKPIPIYNLDQIEQIFLDKTGHPLKQKWA